MESTGIRSTDTERGVHMENQIVNISPQIAEEYLKTNINNRKLQFKRVTQYAEDMRNGKWQLNGESIKFNKSGKLIDGQHRLAAVIKSKATIQSLVTWGVDDNVTTMDRGQNRTTAQCFVFGGVDEVLANNTLIAAVRQHFYMVNNSVLNVSDATILQFIMDHEENLRKVLEICPKKNSSGQQKVNTRNSAFMIAIFYALEDGISYETCQEFSKIVRDGFMSNPWDSPAIVCRNDMLSNNVSSARGIVEKRLAVYRIEKALSDYSQKKERRNSYISWKEPVFSKKFLK